MSRTGFARRTFLKAVSGTVCSVPVVGSVTADHERPDVRVIDDFEWGGPLDDRYEQTHETPWRLSEAAAFTGTHGVEGTLGVQTGMWSFPSWGLDHYPEPGDEWYWTRRVDEANMHRDWHLFHLWGGTADQPPGSRWFPRYMVRISNEGDTHIALRLPDEFRSLGFAGGAIDWDSWLGEWLVVVVKWYDEHDDGRTGIRGLVFDAERFPFDSWSLDAYDEGTLSVDALVDLDSAHSSSPDGSEIVAQEPGRIGVAENPAVRSHVDSINLVRY